MKEAMTFGNLIELIEQDYPTSLAESWDQVGLHFGDRNAQVQRIMTALDIRMNVVDEAIQLQVDTIIVHHPPIFSPIQRFDLSKSDIQIFAKLLQHHIKIYAMHTNVDIPWNGMNDWLAEQLGLEQIESTIPLDSNEQPGLGRVGNLPQPLDRTSLIQLLKKTYGLSQLAIIEQWPRNTYQRIAILGGSGSSYVHDAVAQNADVFLTGDVKYHQAHKCYDENIMTVDVGHYVESIFIERMAIYLADKTSLEVIPSRENTNPFQYE